ncbi:glycoside hydrolase family 78 protein [Amanita thiersii Skay4041]|uniref:Glycoside hydrolase family 78 protein n=1 Tax=Amanita thiersii Skay4041 TaxID=703135 RepID=A0A2A9NT72_9AGAR|nr:glycoside hydrolase family 78 protein [Amanita thiersii Skay4041]
MLTSLYLLAALLLYVAPIYGVAPAGPWDQFNFAPPSRTARPVTVHSTDGMIQGASNLVTDPRQSAVLRSAGSFVVLDFGQEVGGMVSFSIDQASGDSALSLSFTESQEFISPLRSDDSCRSVPTFDSDGVQSLPTPLKVGRFTQTLAEQRGGFRYLTIVSNSAAPVAVSDVSVHLTFMPHWDDLRAYTGYFFARDPGFRDPLFLTKLWYAGAYTVQTNTIDVHTARQQPCPRPQGWANNATGGPVEGPILVDGAKRDRNIWPGDMGISSHTELVALNDMLPTKNALAVMFSTQDPTTGSLQYSGPPINAKGSDTYICWSLIGARSYYLYTGDLDFVRSVWSNYTKAVQFLESQVDSTGLMNVPLAFSNDWGRDNGQGHNSAANAAFYMALKSASELAARLGDTDLARAYSANATSIKAAFNRLLWDESAGMYRDNLTSTIHPQDGNSLAVLFNVTNNDEQIQSISHGLTQFWTDIGPLSPELEDTIIPFVGGFEVQAHFIAGQGERALDLLHKEWGYMLYTNISVQSTLLEGFTANGSLGYRAARGYDFDHSYTSHAHGWATGPTPALSFHVLGVTITSPRGENWSVAPVLSGLSEAEGGFETSLGWFGVKWSVSNSTFNLSVDTPSGTSGVVVLPRDGSVQVDGKDVQANGRELQLAGGQHEIVVSDE